MFNLSNIENDSTESTGQKSSIRDLLQFLIKNQGSDLHLRVGLPPKLRIYGEIRAITGPNVDASASIKTMMLDLLGHDAFDRFEKGLQTNFSVKFEEVGFAVQLINMKGQLAASIRALPTKILTFDELTNFPNIFRNIGSDITSGLVLINGLVGSGYLTSVAALRHEVLNKEACHVLSFCSYGSSFEQESLKGIHSSVLVGPGLDVASYDEALDCARKLDPDFIFIMDPLESLSTSAVRSIITLAKSGSLVIAGSLAGTSVDALHQMLALLDYSDREVALQQIASVLKVSICQRLLRTPENIGRVVCHEILLVHSDIQQAITNFDLDRINRVLANHAESRSMKRRAKELLDCGAINATEYDKV